jgi:hypothetical protein
LPLPFKAPLHWQKEFVSFSGLDSKSALERLRRHGTFKSLALWSVREGKGLIPFLRTFLPQKFPQQFTYTQFNIVSLLLYRYQIDCCFDFVTEGRTDITQIYTLNEHPVLHKKQPNIATKCWFIDSTHFEPYYALKPEYGHNNARNVLSQ